MILIVLLIHLFNNLTNRQNILDFTVIDLLFWITIMIFTWINFITILDLKESKAYKIIFFIITLGIFIYIPFLYLVSSIESLRIFEKIAFLEINILSLSYFKTILLIIFLFGFNFIFFAGLYNELVHLNK